MAALVTPESKEPVNLRFAEEFVKLAKLKHEGALSEQEFAELKAELTRRTRAVAQ